MKHINDLDDIGFVILITNIRKKMKNSLVHFFRHCELNGKNGQKNRPEKKWNNLLKISINPTNENKQSALQC